MKSLRKLWMLVRMYPRPFVKGSALLLFISGLVGTALGAQVTVSSVFVLSGCAVYVLQDDLVEKLRKNPVEELMENLADGLEQVEKQ